ncbi:hypothetical protein ABBQ32_004205 [Trebouxia sp. C0010 RCD-2024]
MGLRQRGVARDTSLEEPLLAPSQSDVDSDALPTSSSGHENSERAIVPRSINKYDWEQLWRALIQGCVQSCANAWNTVVTCLSSVLPLRVAHSPIELTQTQAERLEQLHDQASVQFDLTNEEHQALLHQLWSHAFLGEPSQLQSDRWKDMGWQGNNPATDFRGGGLMSLQNLLFLASHKPALFEALMHKTKGQRAQDAPLEEGGRGGEYPFAAAGVNCSHMLIEMLSLRDTSKISSLPAGIGFLELLKHDGNAFDEVYCLTFEKLDELWLQSGTDSGYKWGYFDFNSIKSRLQQQLNRQLSLKPRSIAELRTLLNMGL